MAFTFGSMGDGLLAIPDIYKAEGIGKKIRQEDGVGNAIAKGNLFYLSKLSL